METFKQLSQTAQNEIKDTLLNTLEYYEGSKDELHFRAFNEDYFIIGYYGCNEFIKSSGLNTFDL